MGNLLKILSFAVDIAKGIGKLMKTFRRKQIQKKDEKEQADVEKIIDKLKNVKQCK